MQPNRRQPTRLPCPWDSPGKNTGVGCHFLLQYLKVKSESEVTQLCPTLSDPMDCSPPSSSIHEICQARVLEWGAIAFSAPSPGVHPNPCPSSQWCHPTISFSAIPFSSLLSPSIFPSIRVFSNESALHTRWQRIGVSASTSVLPMNTRDWSPSGWTGWLSLQSKGLSGVFSNATGVQRETALQGRGSLAASCSFWVKGSPVTPVTETRWADKGTEVGKRSWG